MEPAREPARTDLLKDGAREPAREEALTDGARDPAREAGWRDGARDPAREVAREGALAPKPTTDFKVSRIPALSID